MSESAFWTVVRKHLSPYGRLVRLESGLTEPGIPDVAYCFLGSAGWLELKSVAEWPKRATTPLRIDHLTLEQVLFLETWTRHPSRGQAHGLFRIDHDYLLLDAPLVRAVLERQVMRAQLIKRAVVHGAGIFPTVAIVKALSRGKIAEAL